MKLSGADRRPAKPDASPFGGGLETAAPPATRRDATDTLDLSGCDKEPIHIPGSIQPHGVLFAVEPDTLLIRQASVNAKHWVGEDGSGRSLESVIGRKHADAIRKVAAGMEHKQPARYVATIDLSGRDTQPPREPRTDAQPAASTNLLHLLVHHNGRFLIVELERAEPDEIQAFDALYPLVQSLVTDFSGTGDVRNACALAAREVRKMTDFDRVLIYQFDSEWNGIVVAEERNDRLPSYLDQRFPATDIPQQARELYRLNPVRLIPDASYQPVLIDPPTTDKEPLDLSFAALRSVSPVHVEYMRNMGTASSMSISILESGELWGLISCHNRTPLNVPFHVRTACTFVGQVLSQQIAAHGFAAQARDRLEIKTIQNRLLSRMVDAPDFLDGLARAAEDVLAVARATGAAIVSVDGRCQLIGRTPGESEIRALSEWLSESGIDDVWSTDQLSSVYPPAKAYSDVVSGVLAISFSKLHARYVMWFRPEEMETITWAGNPSKNTDIHTGRIHPRASFESWKETVRSKAPAWKSDDLDAVAELRTNMLGIVLRKAEELAELSEELEASNKELEAFSYSVSHDLRAPFRHIVGYSELLREQEGQSISATGRRFVETIIESAKFAGTLVDNLLSFSQMGRSSLSMTPIDMNRLVRDAVSRHSAEISQRNVDLSLETLPTVTADLIMLRLVIQNLLENALKYTRPRERPQITIGQQSADDEHILYFRDNGVGFDMKYAPKLFGVFQRLHRMEDFEGTGIGLANVRRIIGRHGGRVWAEGAVGEGATFYFSLPVKPVSASPAGKRRA